MPDRGLNPYDLIEGASVAGRRGLFVLGCYDKRITFYSQQVRALALVHALANQGYLEGKPRIAVIGGGAAGLSAAAALALASSGRVVLYEDAQVLLKLQSGTDRRKLDPHIYNWPEPYATDRYAELPILDWESGPATAVREDVVRQFDDIVGRTAGRLTTEMRQRVSSLTVLESGYELQVQDVDTRGSRTEQFDMVFLAIGFGLEASEEVNGINDRSYWDNGGVPGAEFQGRANPQYFVSGNGDGGLIDFVAAASANFDHGEMISTITGHPGLDEVRRELLVIEAEAGAARKAGQPFDIYVAYQQRLGGLVDGNGLVGEISRRLRVGVQLILQTLHPEMLSLDSAVLNRFAVFLTIRACTMVEGCSFSHIHCAKVSRVTGYVPAAGEPPFQLVCDGRKYGADEVIIRRGTKKDLVRQPFAAILGGFPAQHDAWTKRFSEAVLVPVLSAEARHFFRGLAAGADLPGSLRRIRMARQVMPRLVHISEYNGQIRWAGEVDYQSASDLWSTDGKYDVTIVGGPRELAEMGGAMLRIAAHAPRVQVHANPTLWSESWRSLTTGSIHATGLAMPSLLGNDSGGAAQLSVATGSARLARIVHKQLDRWMLAHLSAHLSDFFVSGADGRGAIGMTVNPDLRFRMRDIWQGWHEALEDDADLTGRFLRLMISATDQEDDPVQVLVGPMKLDAIILGTTLALAVASIWNGTLPNAAGPGNLLRQLQATSRTGHGCAADRIVGKRARYAALTHDWKTNFVLLAIEGTLELVRRSEVSLNAVDGIQPSLTDPTGSGPMVMSITEPLIDAMAEGVAALSALLERMEREHEDLLVAAIEKKDDAL